MFIQRVGLQIRHWPKSNLMNTSNILNKGPSALPLYFNHLLQVLRLDSYGHFLGIIFNVKPWKWPSNLLRTYTLQKCLFFYIPVFRRKEEKTRTLSRMERYRTHSKQLNKHITLQAWLPRTGQVPPGLCQALENLLSSWIRSLLAFNITCTNPTTSKAKGQHLKLILPKNLNPPF